MINIIKIITAMLMLIPFYSLSENLISDDEIEVIHFFSYECGTCYEKDVYLSAWSAVQGIKVRRIPVFTEEQWKKSARLFFLIELSKGNYSLSDFERIKVGYSLSLGGGLNKINDITDYSKMLKEKGMVFSNLELSQWWEKSSLAMKDTKSIIKKVEKESRKHALSMVRVSSQNTPPVYIDFDDPKLTIKLINREISQ